MAELLSAPDEAQALEDLHQRGCTDGLPVVIPTRERVTRMVLASGQEADMVLGTMGPGHGIAMKINSLQTEHATELGRERAL